MKGKKKSLFNVFLATLAIAGLLFAVGCSDPEPGPGDGDDTPAVTAATFNSVSLSGSTLTLIFSRAIDGLSASDITFSGSAATYVTKGSTLSGPSGTGPVSYTLPVTLFSGSTAYSGDLIVTVTDAARFSITGSASQQTYVSYTPPLAQLPFTLEQNGSSGFATSRLTLTFNSPISLNINEITTGQIYVDKVNISSPNSVVWYLDIKDVNANGMLSVTVNKTGYAPSTQLIQVWDGSVAPVEATKAVLREVIRGGALGTEYLTLIFDQAIPGLTSADIKLSIPQEMYPLDKGYLSGSGPLYTLPLVSFPIGGEISVTAAKIGYEIQGVHSMVINKGVRLLSAIAINGKAGTVVDSIVVGYEETTTLQLVFDAPIGLTYPDGSRLLKKENIKLTDKSSISVIPDTIPDSNPPRPMDTWDVLSLVDRTGQGTLFDLTIKGNFVGVATTVEAAFQAPAIDGYTFSLPVTVNNPVYGRVMQPVAVTFVRIEDEVYKDYEVAYAIDPTSVWPKTTKNLILEFTQEIDELSENDIYFTNVQGIQKGTLSEPVFEYAADLVTVTAAIYTLPIYFSNTSTVLESKELSLDVQVAKTRYAINHTTTNNRPASTSPVVPVKIYQARWPRSGNNGDGLFFTLLFTPYEDANGDIIAEFSVSKGSATGNNVKIPERYEGMPVTAITSYGFSGTEVTGLDLSKSIITTIGEYAFLDNTGLTEIYLPSTLKTIKPQAFYGCTNLVNVGRVVWDTTNTPPTLVTPAPPHKFEIPYGVTSIGAQAFYNCNSLTNVFIPNGVSIINNETFYKCTSLTEVKLPAGITSIGVGAFSGCGTFTPGTAGSSEVPGQWTGGTAGQEPDDPTDVYSTTPNVTNGGGTWVWTPAQHAVPGTSDTYTSGIETIWIPVSVRSIDNRAFEGCGALRIVNYGGTSAEWTSLQRYVGIMYNEPLVNATKNFGRQW